uniref:Xaa-Pro dipeptidase n=1 Tax=Odontella aurita TaxID=265563 RepID=A0A7S4JPZ6_9STRA
MAAPALAATFDDEPYYSMGPSTYKVPLRMYAANRAKLVSALKEKSPSLANSIVFLRSGASATRDATDHEPLFRQESYFHYLFGVREPDFAGAVEVSTGRAVLFAPNLPEDYATVMGKIRTRDEWRELYGVDDVMWDEEDVVEEWLAGALKRGDSSLPEKAAGGTGSDSDEAEEKKGGTGEDAPLAKILLLRGINTDSGKTIEQPKFRNECPLSSHFENDSLHDIIAECRVVKSPLELSLLRHATELTSLAHAYTIARTKPGMMEYQSESLFRHYCYYSAGMRHLGYTAICGCGPNGAVLHYGHAGAPNDRQIQEGDMCLFDLGAEYCCYGSDVTCSFPASGTFTDDQRAIYTGVLNAQRAVYSMLKPGVSWVDCHKAAEAAILRSLVEIGIVVSGDKTIEELVEMRLGAVFMPHGLGHFIGIDTHDVGGYLPGHPPRIVRPGLKSLRTSRVLWEGMTITVEPGCYFIDHLLNGALSSTEDSPEGLAQYLDNSILSRFRSFGGVRLEDVVAVTSNGCVNYTLCPRTIDEVEHVKRGGKWPPKKDEALELRRERLCHHAVGRFSGGGSLE